MENIKLTNRLDCIIRSVSAANISNTAMSYGNQPYTIIRDVPVEFTFDSVGSVYSAQHTVLEHHLDNLSEIRVSGVKMTNKILELCYRPLKMGLITKVENCKVKNGTIFVSSPSYPIYQVFVFNKAGKLLLAAGEINDKDCIGGFSVEDENSAVQVYYSYAAKRVYSFDEHPQYMYYSLDFVGNINLVDTTTYATIHVAKAELKSSRSLVFNAEVNTVDLNFSVLHDRLMKDADYIAF